MHNISHYTQSKNVIIPKMRNSNIELFRIITMLFIVAHHYVFNSGLLNAEGPILTNSISPKSIFLLIFGAFGKTGINCFVLITGYFMCCSKLTVKKFAKLFFEIEFYTIVIWLIFLILGYEVFSVSNFVKMLLPIKSISNGFSSCYLAFMLFIPFLNILIKSINEKQHVILLILCLTLYTIIGTLPGFGITMNYVSWFIVLYFMGSYLRIYDKKIFSNTLFWGIATLFLFILSILSIIIMTYLGKDSFYFLIDSNKFLATTLALSAFIFFKNLNIKNSVFINTIAASTFGVLMIHANSDSMRKWL